MLSFFNPLMPGEFFSFCFWKNCNKKTIVPYQYREGKDGGQWPQEEEAEDGGMGDIGEDLVK